MVLQGPIPVTSELLSRPRFHFYAMYILSDYMLPTKALLANLHMWINNLLVACYLCRAKQQAGVSCIRTAPLHIVQPTEIAK